jgi:hypothetical protein
MKKELTLKQWIELFNNGEFDGDSVQTQIQAGWYDWFCRDTSLKNKTKRMGQIIKQFKETSKVDLDNTYVWFKNNCPLNGPLFDDFRIADIKDNSVIYTVPIDSPWEDARFVVYGKEDFFDKPLFKTNKQRELVKWFNGEIE